MTDAVLCAPRVPGPPQPLEQFTFTRGSDLMPFPDDRPRTLSLSYSWQEVLRLRPTRDLGSGKKLLVGRSLEPRLDQGGDSTSKTI